MFFPLKDWNGIIPMGNHPGSFSSTRKHDIHTGVDLYTHKEASVYAMEDGKVIAIEDYTGPNAQSPWWLPTKALLVESESGVICYGEIEPWPSLKKGDPILGGSRIGLVKPVLKPGKQRKDILNHSRFMLHVELYKHGTKETVWWKLNDKRPECLLDPTSLLLFAKNCNY